LAGLVTSYARQVEIKNYKKDIVLLAPYTLPWNDKQLRAYCKHVSMLILLRDDNLRAM
jgi:hypothetical protein